MLQFSIVLGKSDLSISLFTDIITSRCCRCTELGIDRNITIVNGSIVGWKHPEDDHHGDCEPLPEAVVRAEQLDREMRHDVRTTGKRPREGFTEILSSVPIMFKDSDIQAAVVSNLPLNAIFIILPVRRPWRHQDRK